MYYIVSEIEFSHDLFQKKGIVERKRKEGEKGKKGNDGYNRTGKKREREGKNKRV
jgi:hypothetical protein